MSKRFYLLLYFRTLIIYYQNREILNKILTRFEKGDIFNLKKVKRLLILVLFFICLMSNRYLKGVEN